MELKNTVSVHGHKFTLSVAVEHGLDWTGKAPRYVHFCDIDLSSEDKTEAMKKANIIKASMGQQFKFTFQATPLTGFYSEVI